MDSMLKAKATLTTPSVLRWLTSGDEAPHVAGIYRRSCNLLNNKKQFLTLALPEVGPGPFTMVIEVDDPGCIDLEKLIHTDAQIIVANKFLAVGKLMVRMDQSHIWNPQPDWGSFNYFVDTSWLVTLQQFLVANAPTSSMVSLLRSNDIGPYYRESMEAWLLLGKGLEECNIRQSLMGANRLAGLGIGLTPSGDDFLLGVIYALWMNQTPQVAKEWSANIYQSAAPRTTRLSAYWLEAAAHGQASKPWHDLLMALHDMDDVGILQAANSLVSFGHTSGFDALTGFILASVKLLK